MMKKQTYLLLFLLLVCCGTTAGQQLDVFGGINLSNLKQQADGQSQDASGRFGYHFGMSVFVPLHPKAYQKDGDGYGFFPALQFIRKGTSKSTILGPSKADVRVSYLQLSVPFAYNTSLLGIGVGPYAACAISGRKQYRVGNGDKEKIDFGNELKRFDFGVGIYFQLSVFKLQYDLGLADLATGNNGTVRTRNFSLSIDIPIVE